MCKETGVISTVTELFFKVLLINSENSSDMRNVGTPTLLRDPSLCSLLLNLFIQGTCALCGPLSYVAR